ncbi:YHYH protein [Kordia sp. YSTF-M3]|uniref:YHYH protein n=1 Tax=Kordia aestuariivivens TaxID=2759037 RepID=A0ABR7Q843_9FLAO|nr:YHYH protein [Kordia aestuariivivens]MBC8754521.1 YHYH protein [Kordia aestuariivivens]
MKNIISIALLLVTFATFAQETSTNTFSVTDGYECTEMVKYKSEVTISEQGKYRVIKSNAIPQHATGAFPNAGNPNTISPQQKTYKVALRPKKNKKLTSVYSEGMLGQGTPAYVFGVAINGVKMEPTAMEFFINPNTREMNTAWSKEALSTNVDLGDDCNNAHVQPTGEYHYHGTPWGIVKQAEKNSMFLLGWAADGFPIYYKYGYASDTNSELKELRSSYKLKVGNRPDDGITAPNGTYDGTYARDFEYVKGHGDLDEANGRFGKTPEFPKGTYYYVITDSFPSLPRFFVGTPNESFKVGGGMRGRNRGGFSGRNRGGNNRERPSVAEIFEQMDANSDGKLSKKEVKGPLQRDFSKVDTNDDGFISKKELEKAPKPQRRQGGRGQRGGRQ